MLDVRITGYVVPLAEQPQASLTPVIAVENIADEDAVITGLIRIYRESTGLLIYDSQLAVTQLAHMTAANIAALTPFDPPAPADDDYFIKADLVATSYLPGPPLPVTFGAWHFDIKTPPMGDAPAGHHVTHEDGGSDPVHAEDLPTTEMDDSLVLAPDGAGGVVWGVGALGAPARVDVYTANDNWTKLAGAKAVYVECIGAGGGGGGGCGGAAGTTRNRGGGGGGGAFARRLFPADALGSPVAVTVGAGGTLGAGGVAGNGADGGPGGTTSFGTHLHSYGGGSGEGGDNASHTLGGGGGGSAGVGEAGAIGGDGGYPGSGSATAVAGAGANGGVDYGGNAEYGGGGGSGRATNFTSVREGGSSLYGGPGGGGGGTVNAANSHGNGSAGGAHGSYTAGGGGGGGALGGAAGGAGSAGDGYSTCGDAGGGGGGNNAGVGGAGGVGGAPGGGGGGGGGGTNTGGAGAVGGRGEVRIWTWF